MISVEEQYPKRFVEIGGLEMAYLDEGVGEPIVFLHGNPSSSYQWRNVIPHLTGSGRCVAPDLVGMGDSAKLPTAARTRTGWSSTAHTSTPSWRPSTCASA